MVGKNAKVIDLLDFPKKNEKHDKFLTFIRVPDSATVPQPNLEKFSTFWDVPKNRKNQEFFYNFWAFRIAPR